FRKLSGWIDLLSALHVEIRDKSHLKTACHRGIGVNDIGHRVDEFDNELGHEVARGGFAAKDEGARRENELWVLLEPVIAGDNVEHVEVVAVVFVAALS